MSHSGLWKDILAALILIAFVLFAWGIETLRAKRPVLFGRLCLGILIGSMIALLMLLSFYFGVAQARDLGQWQNSDPDTRAWYQGLMQPDVPEASCCGEADAYWADDVHVRGGKTFATITDDRDDAPRGRPHLDIGTEIEIPDNKLKWDKSNPTGHGVVFLSRAGYVFCYVQPGGV
jgi:hypothetical protein